MKRMFTGISLAASAAPMAMFVGFFAFRHIRGGIPNSIDFAGNTAACLVGLGLFVFGGESWYHRKGTSKECLKHR